MKEFEEVCAIFQRIAANPEAPVDYLTVRDYLQMAMHLDICEACDKLRLETIAKMPQTLNFGGASEN